MLEAAGGFCDPAGPVSFRIGDGSLPAAAAMDEPEHDQQQDRAERGGNDGADHAAEMDAQLREQPASDESADDAQADVGY